MHTGDSGLPRPETPDKSLDFPSREASMCASLLVCDKVSTRQYLQIVDLGFREK
jgi:hypothetical protein